MGGHYCPHCQRYVYVVLGVAGDDECAPMTSALCTRDGPDVIVRPVGVDTEAVVVLGGVDD